MGRCADRGTFAAGRPAAIAAALLIASLSPAGVARAQTGRHADTAATPLSAPGAQVEVAQRGFVERLRREPWEFTVAPYLWVTTVQGTTGIGERSSSFDVDYSKLFDLLGRGDLFAAMGFFAARKGPITAFVDFAGSMAKDDLEVRRLVPVKVDVDSLFLEFALAWNLLDLGTPGRPGHVEGNLHSGFRWNRAFSRLTVDPTQVDLSREVATTQSWVDPLVGGAFTLDVTERISLYFRGDIGGFGAGSKLAWEAMGIFDVYLGMLGKAQTDLLLGYKAYSFDYETRDAKGRDIRLQETLAGPVVGLAWKF
jgi:hypothetical protein